jgi:hypothetical protein
MTYIPKEIINLIADYHDYDKYCKPTHKINYQHVLNDIIDMGKILKPIYPSIAYKCWNEHENMVGLYDDNIEYIDWNTIT